MADEDYETKTPTIGGMIVREYNDSPSNFRYTKTLNEVFEEHDIPAIWGVDTRALTRIIRDEGSQKVLITDVATPRDEALRKLGEYVMPRDKMCIRDSPRGAAGHREVRRCVEIVGRDRAGHPGHF